MKFLTFLIVSITLIALLKFVFYDCEIPFMKKDKNKDIFNLIKNVNDDHDKESNSNEDTPYVFLTISEENKELGDIIIYLYQNDLPKTTDYFKKRIILNDFVNSNLIMNSNTFEFESNNKNINNINDINKNKNKYKGKANTISLDKYGKYYINITDNTSSNHITFGKIVDGFELMNYIQSKPETKFTIIKNDKIWLKEDD